MLRMDDSTKGMASNYNSNDDYQAAIAEAGAAQMRQLVADALMDPARLARSNQNSVVLCDYGCATGQNSIKVLGSIAQEVCTIEPDTQVTCIHNDLPTNDWTDFFTALQADGTYLTDSGGAIPMVSARSFFEPSVPTGTVTLGFSGSAAHWLSSQPTVKSPGCCYPPLVAGSAGDELRQMAAADWLRFVTARAADLAPGARMQVQCLATNIDEGGHPQPAGGRLLRGVWAVIDGMVSDGLVAQDAADLYVLAVYPRTTDDFLAPFVDGPVAESFEVLAHDIALVSSPYSVKYQSDKDASAYAKDYTGFVRGFSESSLREHLLHTDALVDEFFERFRVRNEADPTIDAYDDCYEMTLQLRRTA